jgi:8-oxo-dGTP pyrophosphatase MutT (NUDIX family)
MIPSLIGAGIILTLEKTVLLLQGVKGSWSFPKGHTEPSDATTLDTAIREMWEETGYVHGQDYEIVGDKMRLDKRIYWMARPLRSLQNPVLSPREHKAFKWVPIEDIEWLNTNTGVKVWKKRQERLISS